MSGEGRPGAGTVDAAGLTLAIAATRWHAEITDSLTARAVAAAQACGVEHPGLIDTSAVEVLTGRTASRPLSEVYDYEPGWGLPSAADQATRAPSGESPLSTIPCFTNVSR